MRVLWLGCISLVAAAQEPPQAKVEALMARAAQQQRTAVRAQAPAADAFFLQPAFLLAPPQSLGARLLLAAANDCPALSEDELKPLATEAAQAAGVKVEWLMAMVAEKSHGRPCAVSPAGAVGLMQLAPATITELHLVDPFDARENLVAGARRLAQLLALFQDDFMRARAAYDGLSTDGPQPSRAPHASGGQETAVSPVNYPSPADKNQ